MSTDRPLPALVQSSAPATVAAHSSATHLCPYRDEVDVGTVEVVWEAGEQTIELHSLGEWLDSLATMKVSHEEYTHHVREQLERLGLPIKRVSTTWQTAGMDVTVHV